MGSGLMTGGFDGWLGPSPGGSGGGSGSVVLVHSGVGINVDNTDPTNPIVNNTGVLSVSAGTGILVDNTDPQNPIVSIDPGTPLCWTGDYYYFCIGADGDLEVLQIAVTNGSDSTSHPGFTFKRWFNQLTSGRWGDYVVRQEQFDNTNYAGGGHIRYVVQTPDGGGTDHTFMIEYTQLDRPISAAGYAPGLLGGAPAPYRRLTMEDRFASVTEWYWNADGLTKRKVNFPNGGPYTAYANQLSMFGPSFGVPETGSTLVDKSISIGGGADFNINTVFKELWVTDDGNPFGDWPGHREWWAHSTAGQPILLSLSLYDNKLQFPAVTTSSLSAANTAALAYDGTLDRLQLSNNTGAYSPILTMADIGPTTGSIVTDIVSAEQDLETATTFTVVPNSTGRKFLPITAYIEFTNVDTLATGPSLKLGNNVAHDNVAGVLAVANTVVTGSAPPFVMATDVVIIDLNATGIICELTVNAVATTCLGRVHVIGVYTT